MMMRCLFLLVQDSKLMKTVNRRCETPGTPAPPPRRARVAARDRVQLLTPGTPVRRRRPAANRVQTRQGGVAVVSARRRVLDSFRQQASQDELAQMVNNETVLLCFFAEWHCRRKTVWAIVASRVHPKSHNTLFRAGYEQALMRHAK